MADLAPWQRDLCARLLDDIEHGGVDFVAIFPPPGNLPPLVVWDDPPGSLNPEAAETVRRWYDDNKERLEAPRDWLAGDRRQLRR